MSKLALLIATPLVGLSLATAVISPANATSTSSQTCSVATVGTKNTAGNADSRFVINKDGTVSATFTVTGPKDCMQTVTLAAWEAPNAGKGQPYDQQKLVGSATNTYAVGTHTQTIKLPTCFYQIDLLRGANPTGPNNSPVYETGRLMGSLHGGTVSCVVTPPTPPVTPPTPPTPPTMPKTIPSTGADETILFTTLFAGIAAGVQYVRQAVRR